MTAVWMLACVLLAFGIMLTPERENARRLDLLLGIASTLCGIAAIVTVIP